ncbi:hypothetical protein MMC10_002476 [Thelotrema lepadinum]|nr:hypothetical protein [Thelotrema lepadinum]
MSFATGVLLNMIIYGNRSLDTSGNRSTAEVLRTVHLSRLQSVLSKVVESITINIINAGHSLGDLPEELKLFCVHLVDEKTFAKIVSKTHQAETDILLLCDRFQGDILLWVIAHFEGLIEVSIAGDEVFRSTNPHGTRKFLMIVREKCTQTCQHKTNYRVELSRLHEGKWINTSQHQCMAFSRPSNVHRQPLYDLDRLESVGKKDILNRDERYRIKTLVQRTVLWMMDAPLQKIFTQLPVVYPIIGFGLGSPSEIADGEIFLGEVLYRWPEIIHDLSTKKSGHVAPMVFVPRDNDDSESPDEAQQPVVHPLSVFCYCFPAFSDFMKEISERCKCRACNNDYSIDECKEGCLREAAAGRFFILIGHAVADGFGVQAVSGLSDPAGYCLQVRRLLSELIDGLVLWNTWFNTAAATCLGYPPGKAADLQPLSGEDSAIVAAQYGSCVVAARWLDISTKIRAKRCFAIHIAEGQISGAQEELAFLQSEDATKISKDKKGTSEVVCSEADLWIPKISEVDHTSLILQHATYKTAKSNFWRLVTVVSTETTQRIINPVDVLIGVIQSKFVNSKMPHCSHSGTCHSNLESIFGDRVRKAFLWSFDDLFASWGGGKPPRPCFTNSLDSDLKLNVALSLTSQTCLVRETTACLCCALQSLKACTPDLVREVISHQINDKAISKR